MRYAAKINYAQQGNFSKIAIDNNLKNSVPQQDTGREYKECALLRALLSKFPFYYESVVYILTS